MCYKKEKKLELILKYEKKVISLKHRMWKQMRHRTCFTIVGYDMKMHAYAKHYAQKCQTYIGQYMRCIGLKTTPSNFFWEEPTKMDTQSKFEFQ